MTQTQIIPYIQAPLLFHSRLHGAASSANFPLSCVIPSITFANPKHPRSLSTGCFGICQKHVWNILEYIKTTIEPSYNHHCDCFPHFLLHFICFLLHSLYVRYSFSLFYTSFLSWKKRSIFGKVLPNVLRCFVRFWSILIHFDPFLLFFSGMFCTCFPYVFLHWILGMRGRSEPRLGA